MNRNGLRSSGILVFVSILAASCGPDSLGNLGIDGTGIRTLQDVFAAYHKKGTVIVLSGVHPQVLVSLEKSGLATRIGEENLLPTFDDALLHARKLLGESTEPAGKATPR